MSGSAIAMMLIGMVIIWGGLGASIAVAVKKARESK
jgi:hypothetical protein